MKKILGYIVMFTMIVSGCNLINSGDDETTDLRKVHFMGEAQGTYYAVTYFSEDEISYQEQIDSILMAFDESVSMWVPGSIISRINNNDTNAVPDEWFRELFLLSKEVGDETNGAFDMTIGPLVNAWGFGFEERQEMDQAIVDSLLNFVDYRRVSMKNGKIIKDAPSIKFDFNAIAQGYSVDIISGFLESAGIENYLVDIGGEVYARGLKPGEVYWKVAIEKPAENADDPRSFEAFVNLKDRALATSGNYRKYYEKDGIRYSHTIDPSTGFPVRHSLLSVSVMADNCALADAYATSFMVMGVERAKEFLEDNEMINAYFIYSKDGGTYGTYFTDGFREWLSEEQP
jgi:thiamine biosynthesis lipoprotein